MVAAAPVEEALIPIAPATLVPDAVIEFSLYVPNPYSPGYRLYRNRDYPFREQDRERLVRNGVECLYVPATEYDCYQEYLRNNLHLLLADESRTPRDRFVGLNEVLRSVLRESFSHGDVDQTVQSARQMAHHAVDLICRHDFVASDLLGVIYHDYHTFTHSANVAYFSVLLAWHTGIENQDDLQRIAAGGLLHDLGKLEVPSRVLNKKGRLTDEEFDLVKQHPATGFRSLCYRRDLTFGQLMMAYQHHEWWNGGGYPVGLVREEIHPWARICAVADVFEALTSDRPYRSGMARDRAVRAMEGRMKGKFEPELLECFTKIIEAA